MNLRLNLILLLIVAVLGGWYYSQQYVADPNLADLIKKEGEADYIGLTSNTMIYDLNGRPQYFAQAEEIKYYEPTERTEFFNPLLNLFNPDTSQKQWQVTASYAEIGKDRLLHLTGKVKLISLDQTSKLQEVETEQLTVNLGNQDISTEYEVKSKGLGFTTIGTGLSGNLKQQVATITKDVKTYLEPTIIRQKPTDVQKDNE